MNVHVRLLLSYWLDCLAMGVILSTAFCSAILLYDVSGFASITAQGSGGGIVRATLWAMMALVLAPAAAWTDRRLRRR